VNSLAHRLLDVRCGGVQFRHRGIQPLARVRLMFGTVHCPLSEHPRHLSRCEACSARTVQRVSYFRRRSESNLLRRVAHVVIHWILSCCTLASVSVVVAFTNAAIGQLMALRWRVVNIIAIAFASAMKGVVDLRWNISKNSLSKNTVLTAKPVPNLMNKIVSLVELIDVASGDRVR
jgi:hypothetical protein